MPVAGDINIQVQRVPQQSDDPAVYNTRRASSAANSQILRMSEWVIASQALDHTSFLQELQRVHAYEGHRSANNAEGLHLLPPHLPCPVCLDRKSSLSLAQAVETLIPFTALSMHSSYVCQDQSIDQGLRKWERRLYRPRAWR